MIMGLILLNILYIIMCLGIINLYIQRTVNFCTINKFKSVGIFFLTQSL